MSLLARHGRDREVVSNIGGLFRPIVQRELPLREAPEACVMRGRLMTGGGIQTVADEPPS